MPLLRAKICPCLNARALRSSLRTAGAGSGSVASRARQQRRAARHGVRFTFATAWRAVVRRSARLVRLPGLQRHHAHLPAGGGRDGALSVRALRQPVVRPRLCAPLQTRGGGGAMPRGSAAGVRRRRDLVRAPVARICARIRASVALCGASFASRHQNVLCTDTHPRALAASRRAAPRATTGPSRRPSPTRRRGCPRAARRLMW